ncbi:uncharacterized protein METZ01_LOCUS201252, partial [marine metagenome]
MRYHLQVGLVHRDRGVELGSAEEVGVTVLVGVDRRGARPADLQLDPVHLQHVRVRGREAHRQAGGRGRFRLKRGVPVDSVEREVEGVDVLGSLAYL